MDLRPIWSHFGEPKNGNEERRRGEEEEEEEEDRKKRRGGDQAKRYGTTNLEYGAWIFGMDPWFCLVNGLPQT